MVMKMIYTLGGFRAHGRTADQASMSESTVQVHNPTNLATLGQ
jgi:hypothetical protein